MRHPKRPAANDFGCCDNGPLNLKPSSWSHRRRRPRGAAASYLVAVAMLALADGTAAAASASSNPPPAISSSMTEEEKYEISKQLAKVDPFSAEVSSSGKSESTYSGSGGDGITLPESMGESALIDRETGQIFWQGGPSVLHIGASSTLSSLGVRHIRATALTLTLVTAALSAVASKLRDMLKTIDVVGPWWKVASVLVKCTILFPRFDAWFVVLIAALYVVEAHCCSTRRYLTNALSGPAAVEEYVEGLRQAPPVARWTVRCFHYEQRKSLAWLTFILRMAFGTTNRHSFESESADVGLGDGSNVGLGLQSALQGPSFLTKKVVTHQATKTYQCASWKDETTVGLWKRAFAPDLTAPFTKLSLCKVLLLSNGKARSDYFAQQTDFVTREGNKDQFAEFSTNIGVEGFKSRVLAVRPMRRGGALSSRFFRLHLFWVFTCLGLTVPYRIWFSRHCDELRVAVIKETFAIKKKPKLQSSSSWTKWFVRNNEMDQSAFTDESSQSGIVASLRSDFRKRMEELAIYQADEAEETRETAALLQQELEKELEETSVPGLVERKENENEGTKSAFSVEQPLHDIDETVGDRSDDTDTTEIEEMAEKEVSKEDGGSDKGAVIILQKDGEGVPVDGKEENAEGGTQ